MFLTPQMLQDIDYDCVLISVLGREKEIEKYLVEEYGVDKNKIIFQRSFMQKIASIGHSFHQKTKSTQFFIDVLLEFYEIDFYWSLPMNDKADLKLFDLENKDYFF